MKHSTLSDNEVFFEDKILITESDLEGIITYANRNFLSLTGYSKEELIGKTHEFIRHPDMPLAECRRMWHTLKQGLPWNGYIKNTTKDGSFYWVHVFVTPRFDSNNQVNGYISTREAPGRLRLKEIKRDYAFLLKAEKKQESPKNLLYQEN